MTLDDATEKPGKQKKRLQFTGRKWSTESEVQGQFLHMADCINIGYFIQWIRDNKWITLSDVFILSYLDCIKTFLGYLT